MQSRMLSMVALLCFFWVSPLSASAAATAPSEHDMGGWIPITVRFPIRRRLQGYFEVQPRWQRNHESKFSENIIRTGLGYEFSKSISVFGGYYYSAHYDPELNHENRLWEQITFSRKFGAYSVQSRLRMEESWRPKYEGCSIRIRNQLRVTRDIAKTPYYVAVSDEPIINLNSPEDGPRGGFAQNRLFIGVGKKINSFTRIEVGYLNQFRNSPGKKPDIMNHALVAQVSLDFTALKRKSQTKMAVAKQTH